MRWWPDRNPETSVTCVVRPDYLPADVVSEGELITVFGQGFTDRVQDFSALEELPLEVDGLSVHWGIIGFDSKPAAILSVTPKQINLVLPHRDPQGYSTLEVRRGDTVVHSQSLEVSGFAPAALARVSDEGTLQPAFTRDLMHMAVLADVLNEDGQPNSEENPARSGELVTVFFSGVGQLLPRINERGKAPTHRLVHATRC